MTKYLQLSDTNLGEGSTEINMFDKAERTLKVFKSNFKKVINPSVHFKSDKVFTKYVDEIPENSDDMFIQFDDVDVASISYNFFEEGPNYNITCAVIMADALGIGEFAVV